MILLFERDVKVQLKILFKKNLYHYDKIVPIARIKSSKIEMKKQTMDYSRYIL